jgi:hypothetical protein
VCERVDVCVRERAIASACVNTWVGQETHPSGVRACAVLTAHARRRHTEKENDEQVRLGGEVGDTAARTRGSASACFPTCAHACGRACEHGQWRS